MAIVFNAISKWYIGKLTSRLARAGLQYHDVVAEGPIYEKAVSRLPAEMQVERARRMKRALDLSSKHEEIPVAARENPWRDYHSVQEVFAATQHEHDERAVLSDEVPTIPYNLGRDVWLGYDTSKSWFWARK